MKWCGCQSPHQKQAYHPVLPCSQRQKVPLSIMNGCGSYRFFFIFITLKRPPSGYFICDAVGH